MLILNVEYLLAIDRENMENIWGTYGNILGKEGNVEKHKENTENR